jgi:hypothetical protein
MNLPLIALVVLKWKLIFDKGTGESEAFEASFLPKLLLVFEDLVGVETWMSFSFWISTSIGVL